MILTKFHRPPEAEGSKPALPGHAFGRFRGRISLCGCGRQGGAFLPGAAELRIIACAGAGLPEILHVRKLGKNLGGYHGETIDIRAVLGEIGTAAQSRGWNSEIFHSCEGFDWVALRRPARAAAQARLIHISAGVHGDEPAGPLAALKLIQEDRWPEQAEILLLPCLNPLGFVLNQRANPEGIDLNRDYRNPQSAEIRQHIAWLERQPQFDLYLCLHEDWEAHGFYLYEQNPDGHPSLAEGIIAAVQPLCPVDLSETIEGRPARGGIIRPVLVAQDRPDWPEALYHITHKSRQGYTLEAPSDFPLEVRVNALVAAVTAAVFRPQIRPDLGGPPRGR